MEWIGCTVCEIFAFKLYCHLERNWGSVSFKVIESCTIVSAGPENPTREPNIASIGKPVAKLWPFLYIQDGRQPPSWILSNSKQTNLTPKTLAYNQTWSGSDAPFARYSPLNCTVTLKLGFGVTQGHRKWHHSIEHIRLYIRLP